MDEFPNTQISLIRRVKDVDARIRQNALEEFAANYRPALVGFLVRCKGVEMGVAEDIVHDFMLNKIINGKVLDLAGKTGRFRSLLRACLQNYLVDQIRKDQRSPAITGLDQDDWVGADDQQAAVDQAWAIALFREALTILRAESQYWGVFKDRVLTQPPIGYTEAIEKYGFDNPAQASNALLTAKRQFNRIVEELIAKQTFLTEHASDAELQNEIEYLRRQLSDSNLVGMVIESLDEEQELNASLTMLSDSIFSERLLLIDESANANWKKEDVSALISHLMRQPIHQILEASNEAGVMGELFVGPVAEDLDKLVRLKEFFSQNARSRSGALPERINVTMTFSCIAAFLVAGGQIDKITSTRPDVMIDRLSKLVDKDWIPDNIRRKISEAIKLLCQD